MYLQPFRFFSKISKSHAVNLNKFKLFVCYNMNEVLDYVRKNYSMIIEFYIVFLYILQLHTITKKKTKFYSFNYIHSLFASN